MSFIFSSHVYKITIQIVTPNWVILVNKWADFKKETVIVEDSKIRQKTALN